MELCCCLEELIFTSFVPTSGSSPPSWTFQVCVGLNCRRSKFDVQQKSPWALASHEACELRRFRFKSRICWLLAAWTKLNVYLSLRAPTRVLQLKVTFEHVQCALSCWSIIPVTLTSTPTLPLYQLTQSYKLQCALDSFVSQDQFTVW